MKKVLDSFLNKNSPGFVKIALVLILSMNVFNEFRRTSAVIELKSSYAISRGMLNARAQIQIILINANLEDRRLNASEIDRIKVLWKRAEYDLAEKEE